MGLRYVRTYIRISEQMRRGCHGELGGLQGERMNTGIPLVRTYVAQRMYI